MVVLDPIPNLPRFRPGDCIADAVVTALGGPSEAFIGGDILVIAQKIVSKVEGRIVRLSEVQVSAEAEALAGETDKDPRLVELILQESLSILRTRPGLIVVEDRRGFVCANAGIDRSNIEQHGSDETVALLPVDPDESARRISQNLFTVTDRHIPVIINDSHGRAWREGTVGVAIGMAGVPALWDRSGESDLTGYILQHTVVALADEIAAAASLVMGPAAEGIPAVRVRGLTFPPGDGKGVDLQRPRSMDLFR